ncbi:DNA primase small subunit [Syncephalis plumigaleata]|nr:DNA primase small subunit [Syncephalis plumigaleata]
MTDDTDMQLDVSSQREIEAAAAAWEIAERKELQKDSLALLLRAYYQRLFPYKPYFQWLNCGPIAGPTFQNREFSFMFQNDIYIRFQSFKDADELRAELLRMCPTKIDMPKDKKTLRQGAFQPLEKELVFDIDMTDYDEIRTCCSGADICLKCWDFMTIAIKIMDRALRDDFGFKHRLWVYSGRRGVHCWVCDSRARRLSDEGRKAIVGWLEVIKGGIQKTRKVHLPAILPPSLQLSMSVLNQYFEESILKKQNVLGNPEQWRKVLDIVGDDNIRPMLGKQWSNEETPHDSVQRWASLVKAIENPPNPRAKRTFSNHLARDIMFQYMYPRLDDKVTSQLKHLLKSPFSIHPVTGRVCVPIDAASCEQFNPLEVPTIEDLIDEINTFDKKAESELANNGNTETTRRKISDVEKTSLKPYVQLFKSFVNQLIKDEIKQNQDDMDSSHNTT